MNEPSFSEDFKKIKEDYLKGIPDKLNAMFGNLEQLKKEPNQQATSELRSHVHQLAGNAATFGFPEVTNICKDWDMKLKEIADNFAPEKIQGIINELEGFLNQLKGMFNNPS